MATIPNVPNPQSYQQVLQDMLSSYASSTGISSPFVGSANLSFFESVALAIARSSGSVFSTLLNSSLQYATGENLQAIAAEFNITPVESAPATGTITVTDTSVTKISTSIYAGANPVNVGSTVIYVGSVTGFPSSGSVYVGRGTVDSEGPIAYSSIVSLGNYYQINLATPTTKYHNIGESVILSQGGVRTVPVNTIVVSPSTGLVPNVQFVVTQSASILDGESSVSNIPVTAITPGSGGNVPIGAISQFASAPFPSASVTNTVSTSGGTDPTTDDQLRVQIQNKLSSFGLGTATAIKNSVLNASATDESASVATDNLISNLDGSSTLYIDIGGSRPYEAKTSGVSVERIVDYAVGGEKYFQLQTGGFQAPVAKAFLQSVSSSPFGVSGGMVLAVTVGDVTTEHIFQDSDFIAPGAATAYEICASINGDINLNFEATTSGDGSYVVIRAIEESNESIQVIDPSSPTAVNANDYLEFPNTISKTLRLYKKSLLSGISVPLNQDGNTASIFTQAQSLWSNTIANNESITITVDNTASITYYILDSDFIANGLYTSVNSTNSLDSWVQVFNQKFTGITASVVGTQIELTSNSGKTARAQISISPSSSLVTKGMFSASIGLSSSGSAADFVLNKNTAQLELTNDLSPGDQLTAGTENTKATISSPAISGGTLNFSSNCYMWLAIDTPVTMISTGVTSGTFISVSTAGNIVKYKSSSSSAFASVNEGDYVIVWSPQLNAANRLEGRVNSITTTTNPNDTLNILVTASEASAVVAQSNISFIYGFVVARTAKAPQKFLMPSGTITLTNLASYLQQQTESLTFSVSLDEYLLINTNSLSTSGSVTVVSLDDVANTIGFSQGQTSASSYPILAHQNSEVDYLPSFFHSKILSDTLASPPGTFISGFTSTVSLSGREPNEIIQFINPYGNIHDEQPQNEIVQESSVSGISVGIEPNPSVRRLRANDRFFTSTPLSFGNNDTMSVVIDNNTSNYTFQIPFYRKALTNTSYGVDSNSFNAYDKDFSPTGNFASSFGSSFSFNNYKVLMQAKKTLVSTTNQSAILYRAAMWGKTGERIKINYVYNALITQISSSVTINNYINIFISIPPSTTATTVASYVNLNLSDYISATVVDDGTVGAPGSGIITANANTQLLDGINWILTSNVSGSPQFVLKNSLSLPSDVGYAFNAGETIILSPTTVHQVYEFMNILPVTGITTSCSVLNVDRNTAIEISSDTYGSSGYVKVVGGPGNGYSFPVINSAMSINNQYASISAYKTASSNVLSGQWFKLKASNTQQKQTQLGPNTNVTITPNTPTAGQVTITLANKTLAQRYFGSARSVSGLNGLNFRVEKQGSLVCFSYVNSTSSPQYLTFPVNFNASGGGTLGVSLVSGTNDSQYTILTGAATFANINIGDRVTISGLASSANNGTFVVTGSSSTVLQVTNSNAVIQVSDTYSGSTFSATTGVKEGDTVVIGSPFSAPNQGSYRVIRTFNDSFWIENPNYIEEEKTLASNSLTFYEYEATRPNDKLVISGTAFGSTNAGTYTILSVTNPSTIVVSGNLSSVVGLNLNGLLSSFYVQEGTPYSGYKRVYMVAAQPGSSSLNQILFDTDDQYQKINQAASVQVTALNKLGFSTKVNQGLDGYKYNTGLIRECNRILYGSPEDPTTYPGVVAAGANVYVKEPLALVVNVSIEVRLQTGAPFSAISEQIRSNVASLISSNPVGQSIAISSIVAVCTTIPGVLSVAILSPLYDKSHDLIVVPQSAKTFVLDASTNISVSLIQ